jgi:stress response protein YsnF
VVEVHETEEVPVFAKTVRVVEDVAIRKEETERTETVRDTVRREDVEVTEPDQQGQPASKP